MSERLKRQLSDFLRDHIPLSGAMGVEVLTAERNEVLLQAPLAPNVNHRGTVFGGSTASVATLAAWAVLYLRMPEVGPDAQPVIRHGRMHYLRPICGDFQAVCRYHDQAGWDKACRLLARHGKARIALQSEVRWGGAEAARFEGNFVVVRRSSPAADQESGPFF